jgi:RNA processing factor Prp31
LARTVSDNHVFVQLVALIGDRATTTATLEEVEAVIGDAELAERVIETSHNSMGQ